MTRLLTEALREQKKATPRNKLRIVGTLGLPLGGVRTIEVPSRNNFVYVKLRDNPSEVIQAFNNTVAPSYGLPVIVERQNGRYTVLGVDTVRYQNNWNSNAPFLPRHGNTHSFDPDNSGGGDVVWIQPRQFMPALIVPSGSLGGPNVLLSSYTIKKDDGTWRYVGNTGTLNLTPYKPTMPTGAVMALVYLDSVSGNPYFIVGSGSYFPASVTGTAQIVPYIPALSNPSYIPLAAVRLVTGTSAIRWDNIYDVRQFIHTTPTGTGGGSSITGSFDSTYLRLDASNDPLTGQLEIIPSTTGTQALRVKTVGNAPSVLLQQIGNPISPITVPLLEMYRGSGTATPEFNAYMIDINENVPNQNNAQGGLLRHRINTDDMVNFNPRASGTQVAYILNALGMNNTSNASRILSVRNGGDEVAGVASWGLNVEGYLEFKRINEPAKEVNAGKIGYQLFDNYFDIVGTNTGSSGNARTVQIYNNLRIFDALLIGGLLSAPVLGTDSSGNVRNALDKLPAAENDTENIMAVSAPGGASLWTGTISGAPAGTSVTVSAPTSGTEAVLVPIATTYRAKMRLYNLTRGTSALINNYNTGTNVVTLTATVPAAWANGDSLTIVSQTVSGGTINWTDWELTSGPTGNSALFIRISFQSATAAGNTFFSHPFSAYNASQVQRTDIQVANVLLNDTMLIKITSNVFSIGWSGSISTLIIREAGYIR